MDNTDVIELDKMRWKEIVENGDKPAMVMFYSPTCVHCKAMEPHFNKYAEELKNKIVFARLNIIDNQEIVARYGIMGTPTFKLFCEGHPVQELVGEIYPSLLKKTIEDLFNYGHHCVKTTTWFKPGITGYA
jgi:thioredoxin 1